jgi:hypothetical protein
MIRTVIISVLLAIATPAIAGDPLFGDLTESQIEAISTSMIMRYAGDGERCPRFHVIERAVFAHFTEAKIPATMLGTKEYANVSAVAGMDAVKMWTQNPSDFCLSVWQLFGPGGLYRRQMVEAN